MIQTFTCKIQYGEHSWKDWSDEDWMPARAHCKRKWDGEDDMKIGVPGPWTIIGIVWVIMVLAIIFL